MSQEQKVSLKELAQAERALVGTGQPHPADDGYVVPVATVTLPSRGKVYSADNTLYATTSVDVKAMTATEENILTSRALMKKGTMLTTLMKACITNKLVDPDQMLVGDRNAVMVAIRVSAYGPEYAVETQCPSCDEKFNHTFDIGRLPLKMLDADPISLGTNEFKFELPFTKRDVIFKLLTGADADELTKTQERLKKAKGVGSLEENVTLRLHSQLVSVGSETDRGKLAHLVRTMPARDSRALRDFIDDIAPGVDMVQTLTCPACGEESEVDVPLGAEFFWPSSRRR